MCEIRIVYYSAWNRVSCTKVTFYGSSRSCLSCLRRRPLRPRVVAGASAKIHQQGLPTEFHTMNPERTNLGRNILAGITVVLGIALLPLPTLLVLVANDAGIPVVSIFSVSSGLVLGLPPIGVGFFIYRRRYRTALYLGLITAAVLMTIIGLVLILGQGSSG